MHYFLFEFVRSHRIHLIFFFFFGFLLLLLLLLLLLMLLLLLSLIPSKVKGTVIIIIFFVIVFSSSFLLPIKNGQKKIETVNYRMNGCIFRGFFSMIISSFFSLIRCLVYNFILDCILQTTYFIVQ